ncbi:putative transmembrane protein [Tieghemostelium lacteum]|uniref:Putative transmembrane protein n=1 Tax=Tieghemostelium lacteum TaxID=361077 RepID=A0A151ZRU1_TIELA|nr:putative transmembrane protein [Tieghemostelium lacteum]|eukprot:KYQ96741.1 putative transmembrane protein [Tieghemostelium lacteum]
MSVPPSPSKTNPNGSIAFPNEFSKIKKSIPSTLNADLETGLFSFRGKEYPADSFSGIILREMGWKDFDKSDKERIAIHWVDQLIHVDGILFSPGGFEGESAHFGDVLNIFKPTFTFPSININDKSQDLKITYWYKDSKTKQVNFQEIVFDANGDIKSRKILSSESKQLYMGIANTLIGAGLILGYYLLKTKLK